MLLPRPSILVVWRVSPGGGTDLQRRVRERRRVADAGDGEDEEPREVEDRHLRRLPREPTLRGGFDGVVRPVNGGNIITGRDGPSRITLALSPS